MLTPDLTDLVRISNEFQFPIAAFHHAHEAYLVPDLLKSVYGGVPPTVAIFATNARYKKEAYRGSEFAAKVLTEAGLDVAFKSDHPVLNSRYLPFEAAQGHHYGLNYSKALSSITTIPAKSIGLDHRLGYVREGYDADIVVWDSFPLNLGATPKQTYIDGIKQILHVYNVDKPAAAQDISPAGEWDEEAKEAVVTRGDPDLRAKKRSGNVIFTNVKDWFGPELLGAANVKELGNGTVVVRDGGVACVTDEADGCAAFVPLDEGMDDFEIVDLDGGSIGPGLVSVGSWLGLKEIDQEKSTSDGVSSLAPRGLASAHARSRTTRCPTRRSTRMVFSCTPWTVPPSTARTPCTIPKRGISTSLTAAWPIDLESLRLLHLPSPLPHRSSPACLTLGLQAPITPSNRTRFSHTKLLFTFR